MINNLAYEDRIANIPGTQIHIYSILMAIAFLTAFGLSWIKLNRRQIPTKTLEWGVLIIAITGIIGARGWFVLNHLDQMHSFLDVVAVWNGGLAVEGGVSVGMIVGYFIFARAAKQLEISVWVYLDCIVPNILLAQAIGRWGNFFNQEVLGADVGHPFSWLPSWINNHLHYYSDEANIFNRVYRHPLFLYESMLSLSGWLLLTFFVPKTGQIFSKKPWKLFPEHYISPLKTNPITKNDLWKPWKLCQKWHRYRQFKKRAWNEAYFDFMPSKAVIAKVEKKRWQNDKKNNKQQVWQWKLKNKWQQLKYYFQPHTQKLNDAVNPHHYRVTYCGVAGSLYFAFYGIIRIILEPMRDERDIMMIGLVSTSIIVSAIWIIIGFALAITAQFVAPARWRKGGWLYEKSY